MDYREVHVAGTLLSPPGNIANGNTRWLLIRSDDARSRAKTDPQTRLRGHAQIFIGKTYICVGRRAFFSNVYHCSKAGKPYFSAKNTTFVKSTRPSHLLSWHTGMLINRTVRFPGSPVSTSSPLSNPSEALGETKRN